MVERDESPHGVLRRGSMQGRRRHSGHQILVPESLKAKVVGERECFDMQQRVNRQSSGESKACVAVQTGCRDNGHGQP